MKRFFLYVLSALAGLVVGAVVGLATGIALTTLWGTSQFEGHAGYVAFLTFMPLGALLGAMAGPLLLARKFRRAVA